MMIADFDLTDRNTFGLASQARYAAVVTRADDIGHLADFAASESVPLRVIGGAATSCHASGSMASSPSWP